MSAFIFLYKHDEEKIEPSILRRMLFTLDDRGIDGSGYQISNHVGMGYQRFYTTPEEKKKEEKQPLIISKIWLVFDGRIDNRDELISVLEVKVQKKLDPITITDAELALTAYQIFGKSFLEYIIGPFALVIWDRNENLVLCARDRTGIRRIYYYFGTKWFIVSTEIRAILKHAAVSDDLNECLIGEYLMDEIVSRGETFYRDIRKLEPGELMLFNRGRISIHQYWHASLCNPIKFSKFNKESFGEEFMLIFEKAVRSRLRSIKPVTVSMSGGLDSTSIACMAKCLQGEFLLGNISAISLVFDALSDVDERECIDEIRVKRNIPVYYIRGDDLWPLKKLEIYEQVLSEGPCMDKNLVATNEVYKQANALGNNVILSGFGGDATAGSRLYYIDLARRGKIAQLAHAIFQDPAPLLSLIFWYIILPFSPPFLTRRILNLKQKKFSRFPRFLDSDFIKRIRLQERMLGASQSKLKFKEVSTQWEYESCFKPYTDFALAAEYLTALSQGVDMRFPFLDSRVVEFIFALPPDQRYRAGEYKLILREAMRNILPEKVRQRHTKTSFNPLSNKGFRQNERNRVKNILSDNPFVCKLGYVVEKELHFLVEEYLSGEDNCLQNLWMVISLELWLKWVKEKQC